MLEICQRIDKDSCGYAFTRRGLVFRRRAGKRFLDMETNTLGQIRNWQKVRIDIKSKLFDFAMYFIRLLSGS